MLKLSNWDLDFFNNFYHYLINRAYKDKKLSESDPFPQMMKRFETFCLNYPFDDLSDLIEFYRELRKLLKSKQVITLKLLLQQLEILDTEERNLFTIEKIISEIKNIPPKKKDGTNYLTIIDFLDAIP